MIERAGDDEDFWLAYLALLDTPGNREVAMRGTVEDWATESLLAARAAYQLPKTGPRIKPDRSWPRLTRRRICPSYAADCIRLAFGWLSC